jgi:ParB family chromosome partitioning protein
MIPIDNVRVINSRARDRHKYSEIVANIAGIGLKRPITVCRRDDGDYDLVCGQGRLQAFRQLGQKMVPAIIRDVSTEDALLMSLVENIARRRPTTMEHIRQLAILRERGYTECQISEKTGIAETQVCELLHLYDHGEERLLAAVDMGRISATSAVIIAKSEYADVQTALLDAVEQNLINPGELKKARLIADTRRAFGKVRNPGRYTAPMTGEAIVRAFKREKEKQRQALKKAELCEKRLCFAVSAVRMLFADENFVNLLRAEKLETLPKYLAEKIKEGDGHG